MFKEITHQIETITPMMAAEYLKRNAPGIDNRPLSEAYIRSYQTSMERGEWQLNGEPICFDYNGNLINGQHRLFACQRAGVPFQSLVIRGLDPGAYTTYDNGRARTVGQLIGMQGVKNYNIAAAAIKTAFLLKRGAEASYASIGKRSDLTNSRAIAIFNADRNLIIDISSFAAQLYTKVGKTILPPGQIAGYVYFLHKELGYPLERAETFFTTICNFESTENRTLDLLRQRILKDLSSTTKMPLEMRQNLIAKVWNAYIDGKELKQVKWDKEREGHISLH